MKPYLRIKTQTFAAGQDFALLPVAGNFLRVLSASQTFTFLLGDETEVDLRPGMGVCLDEAQAFRTLRIKRADSAAVSALEFAYGWQPADKPLVLTDNRAVADIAVDARTQASFVRSIMPSIRGRFAPRLNAKTNLLGQLQYAPDLSLGPAVVANTNYVLNPLALKNTQVKKRIIRLLTGAAVSIGFGEHPVDPSVSGNSVQVTTASPEVVIDGGETLLGYATTGDGDATLSVREVLQDSGFGIDPAPYSYNPSLTPGQTALFPPPSLNASVSYSFAVGSVIAGSGYEANLFGGIRLCPSWNSCTSGTLKTNGKALVGIINTINIANLPAAEVFANRSFWPWWGPNGQLPDDGIAYVSFTLVATNTTSRINTSTGQSFLLPKNITGQFPPGLFRIAFPYDGSAPYFEQGSTTAPSGWVRNS